MTERQPIWSIDELVARTGADWPVRARIWAIEELSHRAPETLVERAPELLADADPAVVEATSNRVAAALEPAEASDLVDGLESSAQHMALLLRAGHSQGVRMAKLHGAWDQWLQLAPESFGDWIREAPHAPDPGLAGIVAHNTIAGGAEFVASTALAFDSVETADHLGAYLHLGITGMLRAFSDDAGARGVAALRSPRFAMPDTIKAAFQEIGSMPPYLPRKRFAAPLESVWADLFAELPDDTSSTDQFEFARDLCVAAVTLDGADSSEAAIRLANRALAAGILRIGVDNGFGENPDSAERLDVWLSFAPAAFTRANQLLLHPSLELGEVSESEGIELAVEAFARVGRDGLTAATDLAWMALRRAEYPYAHAPAIAEAIVAREDDDEAFEEMLFSNGYREMLALAPGAFADVARRGLQHPIRGVWAETIAGLESSGDAHAAELLREHFDEGLRRDAAPYAARALAVLGDPDGLSLLRDAWAPGEPKLASFVLSAAEIVGEEVDDEIAAEGEEAFRDEAMGDNFDFSDVDNALKQLRQKFRAVIQCAACGRVGQYSPPKLLVGVRAPEFGDLDGMVVANRPITCKFCGAEDQYRVHDETSFYIYPHLAGDVGPGDRVGFAQLQLSDGTPIVSATQALRDAAAASESGGVAEKLDYMRVAGLFGEDDTATALRDELSKEAPDELAAFDAKDPMVVTLEDVFEEMKERARGLGRKDRNTRTRVSKVARYGVSACFVSDDGRSPGIGIALMRKMPRGRFALGWLAVHRSTGEIPVAGVELGIGRTDAEEMLDGWNGAPFRLADLSDLKDRLQRAVCGAVAQDAVEDDLVAVWPFFATLLDD
jgi:hypothetical protein